MAQPTTPAKLQQYTVLVTGFSPALDQGAVISALRAGLSTCDQIGVIAVTLAASDKEASAIVHLSSTGDVESAVQLSGSYIAGGTVLICIISENQSVSQAEIDMPSKRRKQVHKLVTVEEKEEEVNSQAFPAVSVGE